MYIHNLIEIYIADTYYLRENVRVEYNWSSRLRRSLPRRNESDVLFYGGI